jgi:hypothetical protein
MVSEDKEATTTKVTITALKNHHSAVKSNIRQLEELKMMITQRKRNGSTTFMEILITSMAMSILVLARS